MPPLQDSPNELVAAAVDAEQRGDHARTVDLLDRALNVTTGDAPALVAICDMFTRLKRPKRALMAIDRAIASAPLEAGAHIRRARIVRRLGLPGALVSIERALELSPNEFEAWQLYGEMLSGLNRLPHALRAFQMALQLRRDDVRTLSNFALTLTQLQLFDQALENFDRALAIAPGHVTARWNRGLCLLAMGRFEDGLEDYEARTKINDATFERFRAYDAPLWKKNQPVAGKRVFLYTDQGVGDTIQFIRFARVLAEMGAEVVVEVQRGLVELCASLHPRVRVMAQGEVAPPFDLYCPMPSLPHRFGVRLDTIPARVPYLSADADRVAAWHERLAPLGSRMRVGLSWAGNARHVNDANRSIALAQMAPLLSTVGIAFVSLQKDLRAGDAEILARAGVLDPTESLNDFSDTAALIANLHLLISVDTSVAHLAGALALPVWIFVPFAADFRWMAGRQDSPWYPTAHLLRQPRFGDWDSAIAEAKLRLSSALQQRRS